VPADAEDVNLTDNDLQSEIELVGDLVVAASACDGPLPQDELDLLLGVHPGDVPPKKAGQSPGPEG
jgi:hypothetical protein